MVSTPPLTLVKILISILLIFPLVGYTKQNNQYLITLANSGLGTAICETLAKEGHSLVLTGRDEKKLNLLKSNLEKKYGGRYSIELFDYEDDISIKKLGTQLKKYTIHGMVIMPPRIQINAKEIPSNEEWMDMFKKGFIAPLEILKQSLPILQTESSIVIISGLSSVHYLPEYKNSNVLRKMWIAETKNLVYQLGDQKLRVNCISPGVILTDFHKNKVKDRALKNNKDIDEQLFEETASIPLHRYGKPEEIAETTAFLLSNKSTYINGTNLIIDGGLNKSY